MFDLQVLALAGRRHPGHHVQLARENQHANVSGDRVSEPHHPLTHNGGNPEKLAKVAQSMRSRVACFAYFLEKLKATKDGNGSLLDHSVYCMAAALGNPDVHDHVEPAIRLPAVERASSRADVTSSMAEPTPRPIFTWTLLDRWESIWTLSRQQGKVKDCSSHYRYDASR